MKPKLFLIKVTHSFLYIT